jgi:hypothetical protein
MVAVLTTLPPVLRLSAVPAVPVALPRIVPLRVSVPVVVLLPLMMMLDPEPDRVKPAVSMVIGLVAPGSAVLETEKLEVSVMVALASASALALAMAVCSSLSVPAV